MGPAHHSHHKQANGAQQVLSQQSGLETPGFLVLLANAFGRTWGVRRSLSSPCSGPTGLKARAAGLLPGNLDVLWGKRF